nr:MAG TPA: hypothetical protein [Crassvirales sp.]
MISLTILKPHIYKRTIAKISISTYLSNSSISI